MQQLSTAADARMRAVEARLNEHDTLLRRLLARKGRKSAASPDDAVVGGDLPDGYSVQGFCKAMGASFSKSTLYGLWKRGRGPRFVRVGKRVVITREARAEWLRQLEAEQQTAGGGDAPSL
jgi:hypothetical protein